MLLEVADKKRSRNVREGAVNYPRKSGSAKVTSERHVSTMSNSLRKLQHSKSCRFVDDSDIASEQSLLKRRLRLEDLQMPRIPTSDFTTNGNTVAQQNKIFNINEKLDLRVPRYEDVNMNVTCDDAWSCPCICIDTTKENHQLVTVDSDSLAGSPMDRSPIIRLSLRKPRNWKWKLTTSASSPAIVLPVIRLTDEQGGVLLDTGEKSESSKDIDSNGNSKEYPIGLKQRNRYKPSENREDEQRINEAAADGALLRKDSEQKQQDALLRNMSIEEGQRLMIAERHRTGQTVETKRNFCKYRRTQSVHTSLRSVSGQESQSNGCAVGSLCNDTSRNKVHRRVMERRRTRRHSSTSTDSSPEVRRRMRRRSKARGDRLLEINGQSLSSCEEATELLKRSSDVVRLKLLRSHSSSSNRKGRHDVTSGNPAASSRRPKLHHQRQNLSSLNIDSGMGSNVSRHSEKGLTGRRTQSHGNLCNGNKILPPNVECILVPCSDGVGPNDRNRFCGSLPNHLDSKHSDLQAQCCNGNNNDGENAIPKNKRNEVELRLQPLPPPSSTLDPAALHDQGYGSERSPEDEHPPSLPGLLDLTSKYSFITRDTTTEVSLLKGSRGLGLSVTGGVDSGEQWPGLIRIKRLFLHQPTWQSGQLRQGDILLAANGVPLIGLTNYQALEVLRKTPNNVVLTVCRPTSDVFCLQAPTEPSPPPPPPRRDTTLSMTHSSHQLLPLPPLQTEGASGEFDIVLTKVNHSLGFTLRKEDESVLGHYVRALVRDPARSDGRIRPGDKIVAVNDVDISPMSHEEAVMFLRQCGDTVKLRLYRDAAQTPVSALSPTEEVKAFKPKPLLRKEAMDMLSDLAVKKLSPCDSSSSSYSKLRRVSDGQSSSPGSSPRRRRLTKTPSPEVHTATLDRLGQKYMVTSHAGNSDSSGDQSQTSTITYPSMDSTKARGNASSFASTAGSGDSTDIKPQRPNFLDLCTSRKQKFTFSVTATGGEEWDSVAATSESDELATNTTLGSVSQYCLTTSNSSEEFRTDCVDSSDANYDGSLPTEPASMPPLTNLSSTSSTSTAFSYRNPAYQSAHPACYSSNNQAGMRKSSQDGPEHASDQDIPGKLSKCQAGTGGDGSRGLLKWKGIVFTPEHDDMDEVESCNMTTGTDDSSSQLTSDRENEQEDQVFMVELTRGWNSRLGFSLQGDGRHTYISAIYADSVAAKDGRLQAGDQVLMVNDENVEHMSTAEVIDLLRKIRGTIGITVLRKNGTSLQVS